MTTSTRHKWTRTDALEQVCTKCGVKRTDTLNGWLYAWPDGRTEERDVDDRVPPCEPTVEPEPEPEPEPKPRDWWAR